MKPLSLMILVTLGLAILLPAAAIAPGKDHAAAGAACIGSLDVCHAAAPGGASSGLPYSIHEPLGGPAPLLPAGILYAPQASLKPLLVVSRNDRPPQA